MNYAELIPTARCNMCLTDGSTVFCELLGWCYSAIRYSCKAQFPVTDRLAVSIYLGRDKLCLCNDKSRNKGFVGASVC